MADIRQIRRLVNADAAAEGPVQCHVEEHAEYEGDQISWGIADPTVRWSWPQQHQRCVPSHPRLLRLG